MRSDDGVRFEALTGVCAAALGLGLASMSAHADEQASAREPQPVPPPASSTQPADKATVSEVVVTAQRLDQARASIQPQVGASVYAITSEAIRQMPGGENTQLDQVILQAPGVTEDSYGQIHVRGEHNGVQYRINGIILPEGLSVFGQALDPRLIQSVDLITGALPAEYGLRTGGIIDITTKSGVQPGGSVTMYGGSHDTIEPSANYHGSFGSFNYFVDVSYLQNRLGIEAPDTSSDPIHDRTNQFHAFAYIEDILSPSSRLSLLAGTSDERFQIPNLNGGQPQLGLIVGAPPANPTAQGGTPYPSQNLNENQRENTQFASLSWLYDNGPFTVQTSLTGRYSTLTFTPDPLGDLLYNGIAQGARKSDTAGDLQIDAVWRASSAHTVRGGIFVEADRSDSDTRSLVLQTDAAGNQVNGPPFEPIAVIDDGGHLASTFSAYLQDEWKLFPGLVLNYGLRFDQFDAFRRENQLSPRINAVWTPLPGTTVHAGYSRYFSPPPFELVAQETIARFQDTTAAAPAGLDTTPYSERANYYDFGVEQKLLGRHLTLGIDAYDKEDKDMVDEGQFGAPIILTPFNYAVGHQYGVEFTANYSQGPFSAYANFATQRAIGKHIISSQFNFDPAALNYIAANYIPLDHSASYTASAGLTWAPPVWSGTRVGADALYGSGLRADRVLPNGTVIPNGQTLPSYVQVNLTASHRFDRAPGGPLVVRLDVINVADKTIELRDGSGVGVFAPQYGPRRGIFAGVTKEF